MPGRLTLGLFNSYDRRRFHEAHRRALARAAPLCLAFDLNLATFGFPYDEGRRRESKNPDAPDLRTPAEIAEFVAGSTTIGEGGTYFLDLVKAGRFQAFPFPDPGFPPQLGDVVVTTSRAGVAPAVTAADLAERLSAGRSQLLIVGLGPHGVPREVDAVATCCFDVTERNMSLETATAMGAMVAAVTTALKARTDPRREAGRRAGGNRPREDRAR